MGVFRCMEPELLDKSLLRALDDRPEEAPEELPVDALEREDDDLTPRSGEVRDHVPHKQERYPRVHVRG